MRCPRQQLSLVSLLFLFWFLGCGNGSNLNKFVFAGDKDQEALSTLMERAELAYDRGRIEEAFNLASLAADKAPGSERAAVLLGFISLSQAGSDPFKIVEKLMSLSSSSTIEQSSGCSSLSTGGNAADVMGALVGCLANIPADEMSEIGEPVTTEVTEFEAYPILKPIAPSTIADPDSPRARVSTLYYLNEAIAYLCPFVNEPTSEHPARTDDDPRHDCQASPLQRSNQVKSHFVWAMAHLVESLSFYQVLMYSTSEGTALAPAASTSQQQMSSNLMKRVDVVKNISTSGASNISKYVKAITELKANFDAVFTSPAEGETVATSMLQSTMVDLKVTSAAFGAIPGVPDEITASVTSAIEALTTAAGAANDITSQSSQLQGQLNTAAASALKTSIDKVSTSQVDDTQKQEICDSFATIAVGTTYALPANQPSLCK